ncbi:hypothetical protein [Maribacter aquivivus]|uniref:hypothetical protein n=1 Tax=Maribacter aquivivus TaxID=228958 RepID=UPI0024918E24|nr:hypothetical protein [Maribacter aquivivus]|tara:strand:+ start:1774 stop:2454 length:681 start_codon:yes stop_codon:yes gene_type:complete
MDKLVFLGQWLNLETYSFEKYIDFIENNFETSFLEIEKKFKELKEIPEDDPIKERLDYNQSYYDHLIDSAVDDHYEYNVFQQRYRYSVVIQLFIFFETEISIFTENHKQNIKVEYKGTFLEKAKKTFKPKVDITKFPQYQFLISFLELRNVIVHYNGRIKSNQPRINKKLDCIKALKKINGFTLDETENIHSISYKVKIENQEFLKYSLKQMEDFLSDLFDKLKEA